MIAKGIFTTTGTLNRNRDKTAGITLTSGNDAHSFPEVAKPHAAWKL